MENETVQCRPEIVWRVEMDLEKKKMNWENHLWVKRDNY